MMKNLPKIFFQKQTQMSIIDTSNEPLKSFSHSSYCFFNTHYLQDTTQWQTPELHHLQILYIGADNIYRCFVNLP